MTDNHVLNKAFVDGLAALKPTDQNYTQKVTALAKLSEQMTKIAELEFKNRELEEMRELKERELENKQAELDLIGQRNEDERINGNRYRWLEYAKLGCGCLIAGLSIGWKYWKFKKTVQYEQDPEKPVFFTSNVGKEDDEIKLYRF